MAVVSIPASLVLTFLGYLLPPLLLTFGGYRINYSFFSVLPWVFVAIHLLVTFYDNRTTYIAARRVRRPFRETVPAIHYFFLDNLAPADDLPRLVRTPFFLYFALEVVQLVAGLALWDFLIDFSRWYNDIWLTAEGAYMNKTLNLPISDIVKAVRDYKAAGLAGDGYFSYGAFTRWVRNVWLLGKQGRR